MKAFYIILLALSVIGCNSAKEVSKAQSEPAHRYSMVYEGNKIINYHKTEERLIDALDQPVLESEAVALESKNPTIYNQAKAKKSSPLRHIVKTAIRSPNQISESQKFFEKEDATISLNKVQRRSGLGWGFAGFLSSSVGMILFFVGLLIGNTFFWPFAFILLLFGLTAAIIGIVKDKSKTDYWFGVGGILGVVITIAAFIIFFAFYFAV